MTSKYGFRPRADRNGSDITLPKERTDLGGDVQHNGNGVDEEELVVPGSGDYGTITDDTGWDTWDDDGGA